MVSISLRVRVWIVLEKLSHVRHYGFFIWFVYIHIYRHKTKQYILSTSCNTPAMTESRIKQA